LLVVVVDDVVTSRDGFYSPNGADIAVGVPYEWGIVLQKTNKQVFLTFFSLFSGCIMVIINHTYTIDIFPGTPMECRYKLLSFGISSETLPLDFEGDPSRIRHAQWLQQLWQSLPREQQQQQQFNNNIAGAAMSICSSRKSTESPSVFSSDDDDTWDGDTSNRGRYTPSASAPQSSPFAASSSSGVGVRMGGAFVDPTPVDVVFGRGKGFQNHDGNVQFHRLVDVHLIEYDKGSKLDKTRLSENILKMVQANSGRFLRQDVRGNWLEVDDGTAREKISRAFRARRTAYRNNQRL
jgi:hypothetical protein